MANPGKREKKEWSIYTYQDEGDKYLGGISNGITSKYMPQFEVCAYLLFFIAVFLE